MKPRTQKQKNNTATKKLLGFVFASKKLLIWVGLLLVVAIAMGQFTPYLSKFIVNKLANGEPASSIVFFGVATGVLLLLEGICLFIQARVLGALGNRVANQIRAEALENITKLPLSHFETKPIGSFLVKTTTYANEVGTFFSLYLSSFAINVLRLLAIFAFMISLNFTLSLLVIGMLILIFVVMRLLGAIIQKRNVDYKKTDIEKVEYLYENIKGFSAIVVNNRKQRNSQKYYDLLTKTNQSWIHYVKSNELLSPLVEVLWNIGLIAVYLLAFYLMQSGANVSVGVIVAFLGYIGQAATPISETGIVFRNLAVAYGALDEIYDKQTLSLLSSTTKTKRKNLVAPEEPHLFVQSLCSMHSFKVDILKDVTFDIPYGEKVLISGTSGSGKTTLAKMLAGLYSCDSGSILLGDKPIDNLTYESLNKAVGMLTDQNFILKGTIKENILLAAPQTSEEELLKASKLSLVDSFASKLPNGLSTMVGDSELMLTEVEKLYIGFARLILQNPSIVILDEALFDLDTKQEARFLKAFHKVFANKTIIYVDVAKKTDYKYTKHIKIESGEVVSITKEEQEGVS